MKTTREDLLDVLNEAMFALQDDMNRIEAEAEAEAEAELNASTQRFCDSEDTGCVCARYTHPRGQYHVCECGRLW